VNVALAIGRGGSTGLPGKHFRQLVGRPLMAYPLMALTNSRLIDRVFVSTDSEEIAAEGARHGATRIERPAELATKEALSEDAFRHGYLAIRELIGEEPETVTLAFCNGATITPGIIDQGIEALRANPTLDSAVTVSKYNMWSALRARRIDESGLLVPFVPLDLFEAATCDRDSQGDTFFADCSGFVVRPRCFDYETMGEPPFKWIGKRVHPLEQWGGLDVDYEWQLPMVEYWLRAHGFTEQTTPYEAAK